LTGGKKLKILIKGTRRENGSDREKKYIKVRINKGSKCANMFERKLKFV